MLMVLQGTREQRCETSCHSERTGIPILFCIGAHEDVFLRYIFTKTNTQPLVADDGYCAPVARKCTLRNVMMLFQIREHYMQFSVLCLCFALLCQHVVSCYFKQLRK